MDTATATRPPAPSGPGGAPPEEKQAAIGFAVAGFLFFGPVGLVVGTLAVGIERAFAKSGWDQPDWTKGEWRPDYTPAERAARRAEARRLAHEWLATEREAARQRSADWDRHRKEYNKWFAGGKQGDPPVRPDRRSPLEFTGDLYRTSKSWGKLLGEKTSHAKDKAKGAYAKAQDFDQRAQDFSARLWNWLTGFVEGIRGGWEEAKRRLAEEEEKLDQPQQFTPGPGGGPQATSSDPTAGQQPGPIRADATLGEPQQQPTEPPAARPEALEGEIVDPTAPSTIPPVDDSTGLGQIYVAFEPAAPLLTSVTEQLAGLATVPEQILARVNRIADLSKRFGAPLVTQQLLDENQHVAQGIRAGIATLDQRAAEAQELTDAALAGLQPAAQNLSDLTAMGASGDLLRAAADAGGN